MHIAYATTTNKTTIVDIGFFIAVACLLHPDGRRPVAVQADLRIEYLERLHVGTVPAAATTTGGPVGATGEDRGPRGKPVGALFAEAGEEVPVLVDLLQRRVAPHEDVVDLLVTPQDLNSFVRVWAT